MDGIVGRLAAEGVKVGSLYALKSVLAQVAFAFSNGPFKHALVARGFDPRRDRAALVFQVFPFARRGAKSSEDGRKGWVFAQLADCPDPAVRAMVEKYLASGARGRPAAFDVGLSGEVWVVRPPGLRLVQGTVERGERKVIKFAAIEV